MILGDPNRPPQPEQPPGPEMAPPVCAKCGGEMQAGCIPDRAHFGSEFEPEWMAVKPVEGFVRMQTYGRKYGIRTYRCKECGYLESYAPGR